MKRRIFLQVALHTFFLLVAMGTFPFGVFMVGVRVIGDNPGALFGGALTFLICYLGLVGVEVLIRDGFLRHLRQRRLKMALSVAGVALGRVILSVLAIDFASQFSLFGGLIPNAEDNFLPALALFGVLVILLELLFLALFRGLQRGAALISARIWPPPTAISS